MQVAGWKIQRITKALVASSGLEYTENNRGSLESQTLETPRGHRESLFKTEPCHGLVEVLVTTDCMHDKSLARGRIPSTGEWKR